MEKQIVIISEDHRMKISNTGNASFYSFVIDQDNKTVYFNLSKDQVWELKYMIYEIVQHTEKR